MSRIQFSKAIIDLPPEWTDDPISGIQEYLRTGHKKLVVIDDDPTGSQTVQNIPVLTRWDVDTLRDELLNDFPAFYVLTNTRGMPLEEAKAINIKIGANLHQVSQETGQRVAVVSRSDSTLRGHFPGEVEAFVEGFQVDFDSWLIIPALIGGGRYTINDIHYVSEGDWLIPVGESAYARDATFGFHSSNLKDWVEEKTAGRITSEMVSSISLEEIRLGGPKAVQKHLLELPKGGICIVNAVSLRDLEVFTLGVLAAENMGRQFVYRTGPSFVPVRIGMVPYPLLTHDQLPPTVTKAGGLIIVGSYVPNTSRQVEILQQKNWVCSVEVDVEKLTVSEQRNLEIQRAAQTVSQELIKGRDVLLFTSRTLLTGVDADKSLKIGQMVSSGLIKILNQITIRPRYILAKGGITSSDVATQWLGVKRAIVLGQLTKGVSAWQLGPESRYNGMIYIVFPGNVGNPETLVEVVSIMQL